MAISIYIKRSGFSSSLFVLYLCFISLLLCISTSTSSTSQICAIPTDDSAVTIKNVTILRQITEKLIGGNVFSKTDVSNACTLENSMDFYQVVLDVSRWSEHISDIQKILPGYACHVKDKSLEIGSYNALLTQQQADLIKQCSPAVQEVRKVVFHTMS